MPRSFTRQYSGEYIAANDVNELQVAVEEMSAFDDDIPDLIEEIAIDVVASSPAVVAAATAAADDAVEAAMLGHDVIEGGDILADYSAINDIIFSVVDKDGRRTALELRGDGHLSARAVSIISGDVGSAALMDEALTGYAYAVVDTTGRMTEVAVDISGKVPEWIMTRWKDRIQTLLTSGPDIACLGDSLTAGAGAASGEWYWQKLATYTGRKTFTNSLGGDTSCGIAARSNGNPFLLMPAGGSIPASGAVNVAMSLTSGGSWMQTGFGYPGVLAGIPGTLVTSATPTFTRTTAGSAVPLTSPQPFYTDVGVSHRGMILVVWAGTNNPDAIRNPADVLAIGRYQSRIDKRMLVLSVLNASGTPAGSGSAYTNLVAANDALFNAHGRRFVDIRNHLIDYGLAVAGISPTSQDTTDIANRVVPSSLRSDTIHLTAAGYDVVARFVAARLTELGWV